MHLYPDDRVLIFVDGPNLYATVKALGFDMDYRKLLGFFRERCRLVRALYYTTYLEQQEFSSLRPLVDWLEYNGFSLVTKPAKEIVDANTGRRRFKGSMRIELTVDALRLSKDADHIFIFTGDGDFRALVAALQQIGKRVSVVSTLATQPQMIADDLRRQADQVVDLADLRPLIERAPSQRRAPEPMSYRDDFENDDDLDALRRDIVRSEPERLDPERPGPVRPDTVRPDPVRPEVLRPESVRQDQRSDTSSRPAVVVERRARTRNPTSDRS